MFATYPVCFPRPFLTDYLLLGSVYVHGCFGSGR